MCQSSSKYVNSSGSPLEVPHSPESKLSGSHNTRRHIEYYPAAHFRRGGGHYPPVVHPATEPYTVLAGSLTGAAPATTTGSTSQTFAQKKRTGYGIGPSSLLPAHHPTSSTIYAGNTLSQAMSSSAAPTPKSRCSSRLSLAAAAATAAAAGGSSRKQSFPAAASEQYIAEGRAPSRASEHQQKREVSSVQRVPLYQQQQHGHYADDSAALNFTGSAVQLRAAEGNSSEKLGNSTVAISSIFGHRQQQQQPPQQSSSSSFFSSRNGPKSATRQQQQQQHQHQQMMMGGSLGKSGSGGSIVRLNGSRVMLSSSSAANQHNYQTGGAQSGSDRQMMMGSTALASQSNSCSDLVLREVLAKPSSGSSAGTVHRVRSGNSMRSVGKISQYSAISLEDDLANSIGNLS